MFYAGITRRNEEAQILRRRPVRPCRLTGRRNDIAQRNGRNIVKGQMLEIGELDGIGRTDMADAEIAALTLNQIVGHIARKHDAVIATLSIGRVAAAAVEYESFPCWAPAKVIAVGSADIRGNFLTRRDQVTQILRGRPVRPCRLTGRRNDIGQCNGRNVVKGQMLEIGELDRVGRANAADGEMFTLAEDRIIGSITRKHEGVVTPLSVGRVTAAAMEYEGFRRRAAVKISTVGSADMRYRPAHRRNEETQILCRRPVRP